METASDHLALLCSGVCRSGRGIHGQVSTHYSFIKECGVMERSYWCRSTCFDYFTFSVFVPQFFCLTDFPD